MLGKGAYGRVYKKDNYAIKKIVGYSNEGIPPTLVHETTTLQMLKGCQYVIKYHDTKKIGLSWNITLDLYDCDLREYIRKTKDRDAFYPKLKKSMLRALSTMESLNIVHCDIKPDNILVNESRQKFVLADFGLATPLGSANYPSYTLWYRPPECLLEREATAKSDIWALGCTLYEALEGKPLFPGADEYEIKVMIVMQAGLMKRVLSMGNEPSETIEEHFSAFRGRVLTSYDDINDMLEILAIDRPSASNFVPPELVEGREVKDFKPKISKGHFKSLAEWIVEFCGDYDINVVTANVAVDIFRQYAKQSKPIRFENYASASVLLAVKLVNILEPETVLEELSSVTGVNIGDIITAERRLFASLDYLLPSSVTIDRYQDIDLVL